MVLEEPVHSVFQVTGAVGMKIRFLVLMLCYQTSMAVASPYPFELTVDDLFTKSDSTNDTTYLHCACPVLCSAFFVNELMKRDAGKDLYGKKPMELSILLPGCSS